LLIGAPVFGAAVELRGFGGGAPLPVGGFLFVDDWVSVFRFGEWVLHEDIEHTAIH